MGNDCDIFIITLFLVELLRCPKLSLKKKQMRILNTLWFNYSSSVWIFWLFKLLILVQVTDMTC